MSTIRYRCAQSDAMQQQAAPVLVSSQRATPMTRVARNIGWLVFAEGFTKAATPVANILTARFLTSTGYGLLALAQTWAVYASMGADLGVNGYGQAEAARACAGPELVKLAEEIIPFRLVAGLLTFGLFAAVVCYANPSGSGIAFLATGLYIPAFALGTDWLIRGRERFDLVLAANGVGAAFLLIAVVLVGRGPHALPLDALAWALSYGVTACIYLGFLHKVSGSSLRLRFVPERWIAHLRQSLFVSLSSLILNTYRFFPLILLGWLWSPREVGIYAAPYRLVINLQSVAMLLPAAFYPVGAALFRDSAAQFLQSRRSVAMLMLMAGLPVGIIGCAMAGPAMRLIFGRNFAASIPVFALIVWLLPLYLVRSIHATTIVSTGFYRIQFLAPTCGLVLTLIASLLLVPGWGAIGAGVSQLAGEMGMVATNVFISKLVHGETALPRWPELSRLLLLNLVLAAAAVYLPSRLGCMGLAAIALTCYPAGLLALGLVNPATVMTWVSPASGRLAK